MLGVIEGTIHLPMTNTVLYRNLADPNVPVQELLDEAQMLIDRKSARLEVNKNGRRPDH